MSSFRFLLLRQEISHCQSSRLNISHTAMACKIVFRLVKFLNTQANRNQLIFSKNWASGLWNQKRLPWWLVSRFTPIQLTNTPEKTIVLFILEICIPMGSIVLLCHPTWCVYSYDAEWVAHIVCTLVTLNTWSIRSLYLLLPRHMSYNTIMYVYFFVHTIVYMGDTTETRIYLNIPSRISSRFLWPVTPFLCFSELQHNPEKVRHTSDEPWTTKYKHNHCSPFVDN